jgi:hypothetical protein
VDFGRRGVKLLHEELLRFFDFILRVIVVAIMAFVAGIFFHFGWNVINPSPSPPAASASSASSAAQEAARRAAAESARRAAEKAAWAAEHPSSDAGLWAHADGSDPDTTVPFAGGEQTITVDANARRAAAGGRPGDATGSDVVVKPQPKSANAAPAAPGK